MCPLVVNTIVDRVVFRCPEVVRFASYINNTTTSHASLAIPLFRTNPVKRCLISVAWGKLHIHFDKYSCVWRRLRRQSTSAGRVDSTNGGDVVSSSAVFCYVIGRTCPPKFVLPIGSCFFVAARADQSASMTTVIANERHVCVNARH